MGVFKSCGVMLDMSRDGVMTVEALKRYIVQLRKMEFNTLYLYMEDTYELPGYPMFGAMRGRYSMEELKEIDRFCTSNEMTLIPAIQTLGHMEQYLRYTDSAPVRDTERVLLCGAEETYQLIETMVKTMRTCVSGNKLHIGMDEAMELGSGRYFQLHGYRDKKEIFLEHLDRVCAICKKYNFTPMIWDDVARDLLKSDEQHDLAHVLPDLEIVPWSYGCCTPAPVEEKIGQLKVFDRPITFANGAWTWGSLLPIYTYARATIVQSAKAAADQGVDSIMLTLWGDDGCQTNYELALNHILMLAAYNQIGELPDDEILQNLASKYDLPAFEVSKIAGVADQPKGVDTKVGKRLLWGDLLINSARIFDKDYEGIYVKAVEALQTFVDKKDKWQRHYEYIQLCLQAMGIKAHIITNLRERYLAKDQAFLWDVCDVVLPKLHDVFVRLEKAHRYLWLNTYKPQGYQKVEGRYGAQLMRIDYTRERLTKYLNGEIEKIDELTEEPIPCPGEENMIFCNNRGMLEIDYDKWICARHLIDVSV